MIFTIRSRRSLGRGIEILDPKLPKIAAGRESNGFVGCLLIPLLYVVVPITACVSAFWMTERIVLTIAYDNRYESGLRIINKQMELSDGTTLPVSLQAVLIIVPFIMMVFGLEIGHALVQRVWGE